LAASATWQSKEARVARSLGSGRLGLARWLFILAAVLLLAAGCPGNVKRKWSEEVALDDGRIITIDRFVMFKQTNSFAGDAYNSTDLASRLGFQGELETLPIWSDVLVPILLYHDAGRQQWVIVATTSNCETWNGRGSPFPMYWEYRVSGGKWMQTKLSEASIGRKTNLFFSYEPKLPAREISVSLKEIELKQHPFAKEYLTVVGDIKEICGRRPP
jgi:hypothetical protein